MTSPEETHFKCAQHHQEDDLAAPHVMRQRLQKDDTASAWRPPTRLTHAEFDALVLRPNVGRTLWIVWRPSVSTDPDSTPNAVLASLEPRLLSKQESPTETWS
jgi:hypothetical protein